MSPYPWKKRLLVFSLFMVGYTLFYVFPNFHPLYPPNYLPLLSLDEKIPLTPWTFAIYLSDYPLFLVAMALLNDPAEFYGLTRKCFLTLFICGVFFFFFPTRYPRPVYPEVSSAFLRFGMAVISGADTPNNCFPSMHVALTGAAAWSVRKRGPVVFGLFVVWSLAIFISTLTTKQHYCLDVVGGMGVIVVVAVMDWALFERSQPELSRLLASKVD